MTAAVNITRLLDGAHLRADLVQRGADRLMVTFDYRRLDRDGFGPFVPSEQFAEAGFDQLMIATRDNDWFINPDTPALESVCRDLRRQYSTAQALGYSMGGFGAFRFSRALGLSHVVAVSPQVSIAPQLVPFETRYTREARRFDPALGDLTAIFDAGLRGHILFDPFNLSDLTHAQMLQVLYPRVALVRLPGGGHPCTRILRDVRRAGLIQALAMTPSRGPTALQSAHRAARANHPAYWRGLQHAAAARHPVWSSIARQSAANMADVAQDGVDEGGDSA
ncbi:alpha/beta hydrolase [Loktanella salsilacus]|uniref:alpha/beta hydrolase n=1 Tax=Loktanella salsilacus TaxID=195913 RepID=UPI00373559B7